MVNQPGEAPDHPAEGAVRFDAGSGRLMVFDGRDWVPLVRIPDLSQPAIFRGGQPEPLPSQDDADEADGQASP